MNWLDYDIELGRSIESSSKFDRSVEEKSDDIKNYDADDKSTQDSEVRRPHGCTVVGDIVFTQGKATVNYANIGIRGVFIPSDENEVHIRSSIAKFTLIVQKDVVYKRLAEDGFYTQFSCIIITGKGQPDVGTTKFLKMLNEYLQIPVYTLLNFNPYGLHILSAYAFGSKNISYDSSYLTTSNILWLGLRPSN
ncbi:hypothetical protein CTI12_AA099800 [Artemisia annua]|uniref:Topoisomerase 6 subunit A/Spo11 TOPRIM domain-containing protein n=1 Tax=Artemisia annua TaxID=35608 RepID=A0A2U1PXX3_ARTAN|nr:hypothetical protein CTI12_AA099800 [Artemisia annua]